jgi:hypothetical protein
MKNMTTIAINGKTLGIKLGPIASDGGLGAWRNGTIILEDGTRIDCGGGWVENEEGANQRNEAAGIAGGMRQGVWYPNETHAGDYVPYKYGEDESGWQEPLMQVLYGEGWENHEDADEEVRDVYASIQDALSALAK